MRLLSRLLAILAVCAIAVALPAAPVQGLAEVGPGITLNHESGVPGDNVRVYGRNFTEDSYIDVYYDGSLVDLYVNGSYAPSPRTDADGDFQVDFTIPPGHSGSHVVLAKVATQTTSTDFEVRPGLMVDPEDGPVGSNITVEGVGFGEDEEDIEVRYYPETNYEVVLEGINADEDGSWEQIISVPSSARGAHRIDAAGEDSSASAVRDTTFEVTPAIGIFDGSGKRIDNPVGSPDQNITMTGTGFAAEDRYIKILFEGEETQTEIIRADDDGYWQGKFEVPRLPIGDYSVTAEGQLTPEEDIIPLSFEIRPGLVLSPDTGHVGTQLGVTGSGFSINQDVVVLYDGDQVQIAEAGPEGTFQISFVVPRSESGPHEVTAEDAADNVATAIFTMESNAPGTPQLESPARGSRVGVIGKVVKPTFRWTAVSDQSGVYYNLQIAAVNNLTGSGFTDPIVSIDNIVGANYTLEKGLSYGNYYWVVQAVDGAGNKGQWSEVDSFHAGALPLWAFILAIVVFVALVGTLVYYFVIRKRIYYY